jgi:hypothetical protein
LEKKPLWDAVPHTLTIINVSVHPSGEGSESVHSQATAPAAAVYPAWQRKLEHVMSNLEVWSNSELRARIEDTEEEMLRHWKFLHESGVLPDKRESSQLRRGLAQLRQLRIAKRIPF